MGMVIEQRTLTNDRLVVERSSESGSKTTTIRGYGAVFYRGTPETEFKIWDDMVERIMPEAFDRALKEKDDVRALFNHDPSMVLGRRSAETLKLSTDNIGLLYEIPTGDTTVARDLIEHLRRKDISGSSFSFRTTDEDFRRENGVIIREIRGVELFDVGPVTFPAYEATTAGVRGVEGRGEALAARERFLLQERVRKAKSMAMDLRVAEIETGA